MNNSILSYHNFQALEFQSKDHNLPKADPAYVKGVAEALCIPLNKVK